MFTRAVFFALRDTASHLAGSCSTTLRYSETGLVLEFWLPEIERKDAVVPGWLSIGLSIVMLVAFWQINSSIGWRSVLVLMSISLVWGIIRPKSPTDAYVGEPGKTKVQVRYHPLQAVFRFEKINDGNDALPLGDAVQAAAITAIRVARIDQPDTDSPPMGLVEVRTPTHDYRLFAAFDTEAAAREFARALQYIVDMQPAQPQSASLPAAPSSDCA